MEESSLDISGTVKCNSFLEIASRRRNDTVLRSVHDVKAPQTSEQLFTEARRVAIDPTDVTGGSCYEAARRGSARLAERTSLTRTAGTSATYLSPCSSVFVSFQEVAEWTERSL